MNFELYICSNVKFGQKEKYNISFIEKYYKYAKISISYSSKSLWKRLGC